MSQQCTPDCPNNAQVPIQVESGGNNQIIIKITRPIPLGTSKVTLQGKDDILQQLDKIICKAVGEDLNFTPEKIDNGKCLEFTFTPRQTAIQTLSCSGVKPTLNLGLDPLHFCLPPSNTTIMPSTTITPSSPSPPPPPTLPSPPSSSTSSSSPTSSTSSSSPPSSSTPSLTSPPVKSSHVSTNTSISTNLASSPDIPTVTSSSILTPPILPPPPETPGTNTTITNKATSKASLKGEVAGGVLGGIALILIIFILWRRYRRLRNISTSHNEKAMTYRTSQRSSLWSSVPLTSSMLAEATKFDPTRMVKTGLPFDKNTPLAKNPTGGVHPLLPYP